MNWTGGKLQRHSRTNADRVSKAQKQHFAKARLQRQYGCTGPTTSHLDLPNDIQFALSHTNTPYERRRQSSKPSERGRLNSNVGDLTRREPSPIRSFYPRYPSQSVKANTFEGVRKSLLRSPDWLKLSAVKPVHMKFPSANELANVAERRKLTQEDRARQQRGYKRQLSPASIKNRRNENLSSVAAKLSVRIGSDIHRTQSTSSRAPPEPTSFQVTSSETMLLDQTGVPEQSFERRIQGQKSDAGNTEIRRENFRTNDPAEDTELPTLDRFLDSRTFDEVKLRSDTLSASIQDRSRSTYPSSPPLPRDPHVHRESIDDVRFRSPMREVEDDHENILTNSSIDQTRARSSMAEEDRWHPLPCWYKSRPLFTLDRQVEEERNDHAKDKDFENSARFVHNATNSITPLRGAKFTIRRRQLLGGHTKNDSMSNSGTSSRPSLSYFKNPSASKPSLLSSKRPHSTLNESLGLDARTCNDNEAWMKIILGDELDEINDTFHFSLPCRRFHSQFKRRRIDEREENDQSSRLEALSWTTGRGFESPTTIRTSANTSLHTAHNTRQLQSLETDFLSQLSPMEGLLDDRLANISLYNNPARTDRSFISAPRLQRQFSDGQTDSFTTPSRRPLPMQFDPTSASLSTRISPSQSGHRTPLHQSSTPLSTSPTGQFSNYFPISQHTFHTTKPSSPPPMRPVSSNPGRTPTSKLVHALSSSIGATTPGHSSSHRKPLQNIHTETARSFMFTKPSPPRFSSGQKTGPKGLTTSDRLAGFRMPSQTRSYAAARR